jgi:hypothetical protein
MRRAKCARAPQPLSLDSVQHHDLATATRGAIHQYHSAANQLTYPHMERKIAVPGVCVA